MKRLGLFLVVVLTMAAVQGYSDAYKDFKAELDKTLKPGAESISKGFAKNFGFYTGSGNATAANTSGFLGLKLGAGIGVDLPGSMFKTNDLVATSDNKNLDFYSSLSVALGKIPLPYDMVYLKVGLPSILPSDADVGLRLGFLPDVGSLVNGSGNGTISTGAFHIGAEGRYLLWKAPANLLSWDARASVDFDTGHVYYTAVKQNQDVYVNNTKMGTISSTPSVNVDWGGVSIGAKTIAGLNIPFIGNIYGGLGLNMNLGGVDTEIKALNEVTATALPGATATSDTITTGKVNAGFNLFDIRLLAGASLFFINASFEYGPLDGSFAVNIIPLALAF